MIVQSAYLIKSIVERRINQMRRREMEERIREAETSENPTQSFLEFTEEMENEEDGGVFVEGMFGGLLTIPLPVPEIIQSLDKTKFKNK